KRKTYAQRIEARLRSLGYRTTILPLKASSLGVPQDRTRLFIIGIHSEHEAVLSRVLGPNNLAQLRRRFLRQLGLGDQEMITTSQALSDLEVAGHGTRPSSDTLHFLEPKYGGPKTKFQKQ